MKTLSIYVHWPFCETKCPYCDFNSHLFNTIDTRQWMNSYKLELDFIIKKFLPASFLKRPLKSIFFGGGTPSLMNYKLVEGLINYCLKNFIFAKNIEITLEANPKSISKKSLQTFRSIGINRVSLGVQSFNDLELKFLGRNHSVNDSIQSINDTSDIFQRNSFDLIYGLPSQTLSEWKQNLNTAFSFKPKHLSLYQLTIERGTAFHRQFLDKKLIPINNERASKFFDLTMKKTSDFGLNSYEISNFCFPKEECIHNLVYWNGGDWLGIGPGAHGRISLKNNSRLVTQNRRSPTSWLNSVQKHKNGLETRKVENSYEISVENLIMGLRQKNGVVFNKIKSVTNYNSLEILLNSKMLEFKGKKLKATYNGKKVLDSILLKLLD